MKTYEATEQAYKNGYEKGKADALKWISVKEECPRLRERKYYTVPNFDGTHEYTSSGFVVGLAESKTVIVEYCEEDVFAPWRDKAGYRSWFDENGKKHDVTHWMPLPEPPKGE